MNAKKIIIVLSVAILIFLSFLAGNLLEKRKVKKGDEIVYSQGWEDARKEYAKVCVPSGAGQKIVAVKNLFGAIKEINGDKLIIDAHPLGLGGKGKMMEVAINKDTQIKQVVVKADGVYQKELIDYRAKVGGGNIGAEPSEPPPSQFDQVKIEPVALKTGDVVTVTATADFGENDDKIVAAEILADYRKASQ